MASKAPSLAAIIATTSPSAAIADLSMMEVSDDSPDFALVEAWNDRQIALAMIEERGRYYNADSDAPTATKMFDAAELRITQLPATTFPGILAKLWVALAASGGKVRDEEHRAQSDAIRRADLAEVEAFGVELEYEQSTILSAIRSLDKQVRA